MKKIVLPGILAGVVALVLGMLISYLFMLLPTVAADYKNTNLMRSWSDPLMMVFMLYPFLQCIIYAWAWDKTKTLFHGTLAKRGAMFGLSVWLIATIPGMFVSYTSFPIALLTIISWTVGGLVNAVVSGMIFAKMNQ